MRDNNQRPIALGAVGGRLFGVVHLLALPGSPEYGGSRQRVLDAARADAEACLDGGLDGFVIENFGDRPFRKGAVGPSVVAEMTRIASELVALAGPEHPVGINVLRNDAESALAIAAAVGARFVRVNVHTGVMLSDQGVIEGEADATLRSRRALDLNDVAILADVWVKHAVPPAGSHIEDAARDVAYRGLADGLIVTGRATGAGVDLERLRAVRGAVPDRPLFAGSGVTPSTLAEILRHADGVIVGTAIKHDVDVVRPIDRSRVKELVNAR